MVSFLVWSMVFNKILIFEIEDLQISAEGKFPLHTAQEIYSGLEFINIYVLKSNKILVIHSDDINA